MPVQRIFSYFSYGMAALLLTVAVLAQESDCPVVVRQAFETANEFCRELGRNSACYGSNRVEAAFYQEVAEDFFTLPGDLTALSEVESLRTFPLAVEDELWGVAVLQVQANLPNTLPGQNVVFLLLGDSHVIDDVAVAAEVPDVDPVDVTVNVGANLRSGPSQRTNVVEVLSVGTAVQADGLSADESWTRLIVDDRPGWMFADLLTGDFSDLPVVEEQFVAPMQAFHMTTGFGTSGCVEAPDAVLVQGIEDFEIEFQVNGANVRIASTTILELLSPEVMQLSMVNGTAWVDNLRIPAGWKAQIQLDPEGGSSEPAQLEDLPEAVGQWTNCEPLSEADLARIRALSEIPVDLLNYEITVPTSGAGSCLPADAPDAGGTTSGQTQTGTCRGFALLGPFANITPRPTTFSWTRVNDATEYELVFHSVFTGQQAGSFRTPNTNLTVTVGDVPTGAEMQLEVRAYRNGEYLCVTPRTGIITLMSDPNAPVPSGSTSGGTAFTATAMCIGPEFFSVTYSNAPAGSTQVDMHYIDATTGGLFSHTGGSVPNGTLNNLFPIIPPLYQADSIYVVALPSGTTVFASPSTLVCP
jgi:hypothetical protein